MSYRQEYGIIASPDILTEEHVPPNIPGREPQIKELQLCLSPASKRNKPFHAWLHGKPGAGKTVTARFLLSEVQSAFRVKGVYVNCWEHGTFYSVLDKLVLDLRILGADKPDASFKLERLERFIKDEPTTVPNRGSGDIILFC